MKQNTKQTSPRVASQVVVRWLISQDAETNAEHRRFRLGPGKTQEAKTTVRSLK